MNIVILIVLFALVLSVLTLVGVSVVEMSQLGRYRNPRRDREAAKRHQHRPHLGERRSTTLSQRAAR
jgi:hypothetical protein